MSHWPGTKARTRACMVLVIIAVALFAVMI